ncbi:retron Ec67 family RNA-directed DNA polymerase/endonuclease [Ochrobactrum sp. 19YEA23]|uniref:retron Ec67 family RNA-directed DNA polymerase/endonuclease n=1 Tax=Ochrobactrum sp. 19YEA23 TaxID=3039854 RepID=UPI00247A6D81
MTSILTQSASALRNIKTLGQLAVLLKEQPKVLSYWLYKAPPSVKYITYTLPKRNGGFRRITAPQDGLKRIQGKLANLLSQIYNDLEQKRIDKDFNGRDLSECVLAHGFKNKYNVFTNAKVHVGKRFVFNTDLEEFFPSITFGRVRGFFITDNNFKLEPVIATIIAQLACHKNELPQGAPCSPIISNFIAHMLDIKLNKMAKKGNCSYTRYADDITFSTNEREFPHAIARLVAGTRDRWVTGDGLLARVYASGFRINHDKSRMQLPYSRQETTGLTVNQKVNVSIKYYKTARSQCQHLFSNGYCFELVKGQWMDLSPRTLQGRMDFIHYIRRARLGVSLDRVSKKKLPLAFREREQKFCEQQKSFSNVYRNLLNYNSFHGMKNPTIVCEGITDGLYINAAIKTIGSTFPSLYDPGEDCALLSFYKHTDKRKFYQIGEGATQLIPFIRDYTEIMSPFTTTPRNPVIIILDQDEEGLKVFNTACARWKKDKNNTSGFTHLVSNLYIMLIPLKEGKADTCIEDLFDQNWLASETLNGKTFSKNNNYNPATNFGKFELAGKVIRPKRTEIDWSGFVPILDNISSAIDHFNVHKST